MSKLARREFLRWAGMGVASVGLLAAGCTKTAPTKPVVPTLEPTPTDTPTVSVVRPTVTSQPAQAIVPTTAPPTAKKEQVQQPPTAAPAEAKPQELPYMSVIHGDDPQAIVSAAIASIGGMGRFVSSGAEVIIKPNICTDYYPPEYAATTNPDVVAALITLCLEAGAKRVRVMDTPFGGTAESAYGQSGIAEATRAAGGQMEVMSPVKFQKVAIPDGLDIHEWTVYDDLLKADVVINVPIAKHHSLARLTLGGKNLLGVVQNPGGLHRNIGQRVADLVSVVRPTLTVIDAYRILTANGPTGGNLDDVLPAKTIIASPDIVAADAWGATLFGLSGSSIGYIKAAAEMGLGTMDLDSITIDEQNL